MSKHKGTVHYRQLLLVVPAEEKHKTKNHSPPSLWFSGAPYVCYLLFSYRIIQQGRIEVFSCEHK